MSLDQQTAKERAALIRKGSISYNYNIILMATQYYGLAELTFYLQNVNFDVLKIDFTGKIIQEIVVNSMKIAPDTTDNFIKFAKAYLQKGKNKISIMYINEYDKDRIGCITFKDTFNGKDAQYIYTDFQPYGAHRVFPCFDQPNLKAEMKLSVVTPTDWSAFSNQPETLSQKYDKELFKKQTKFTHQPSNELLEVFLSRVGDDTKMTTFQYTPLISTYIFALAAGPYDFVPYEGEGVPMRAIAPVSSIFLLGSYSNFIFDVTTKAMKFFEEFFGTVYQFQKYDMIWVREYESWAMENAGLVTFSEDHTLKPYATEKDYYDLADTLVHELVHHWFGNLVTMDWWDDLWLNESFADFMAQFALGKINGQLAHPLDPPAMYFRDRKAWGYEEDQRNGSTHPIRGEVPDTDVAASIFDGITYAKGAAVMKQLMFLVGEQNFSTGLTNYFQRFSWDNATITDFLQDLKQFFPTDIISLDDWSSTWLETASLNVFESIWDPASTSTTSTLSLYQSPFAAAFNTLRSHKMEVAFFGADAAIIGSQTVLIPPNGLMTTVTYDGSNHVEAILLNYNDQCFFENILDPKSLNFFKDNISGVQDDLTRSLIWYTIAQMVKKSLMRVDDYTAFIIDNLFNEPLNFVLDQLLTELLAFLTNYTAPDEMQEQCELVFEAIYEELAKEALTNYDRVTVLTKHWVNFAQNDYQILRLKDFLMKEDPSLAGRQIVDEDLPWAIVKKIFSVADETLTIMQKEDVFASVLQLDDSSRSEDARVVCDTILLNTPEQIAALYAKFTQDSVDLTTRYLLIEGWKSKYHRDLTLPYENNYFDDLLALSTKLKYAFFQFFYSQLRPTSQNYIGQELEYSIVLVELENDPTMAAHVKNIKKIVDDISLYQSNLTYNHSDSNATLTQLRAIDRKKYIVENSVSYISHVGFVSLDVSQQYSGLTEITFTLSSVPNLLPIDFVTTGVSDLVVNGYNVAPLLSGEFLLIPRIYLKVGVNNVAVNYTNTFNNDGLGCLSFIDTSGGGGVDSKYYIYTQFEPYSAHRLIPCFDQPDLKATIKLNIILPDKWTAVANADVSYTAAYNQVDYVAHAPHQNQDLLVSKYLLNKSGDFYIFNETKPISTYLYCLAAGQYYSVTASSAQEYNSIPMSIYCLQSYKDALDMNKDFIFEINKLSIQFFVGKFQVDYPFPKYDTVFCHQFSAGAMENPGIITFNDIYLYQEVVSIEKMVQLAVVIAHECAHNWFGDLVTMKWWDDLWLNESFADFMAYFCIDGIKDKVTTIGAYTTGWIGGVARVVGGYREDQMTSTTHSIYTQVPNTSLATVYFDNITYRKGLSVLKQLMFLMGETGFFSGVTAYFNEFQWKNATKDNFLSHMNDFYTPPVPKYTLDLWTSVWLETPSLNVLTADWDPTSVDPAATLTINQSNYDDTYNQLRFHLINIAFVYQDGSYSTQKLLVNDTDKTTTTYDASKGVKAILLNQGIEDFVKVTIDDTSLQFFMANINLINKGDPATDALTRMVIWFYMNEMVRDQKIKVWDYRDVVLNLIADEPEDGIYQFQLAFINQATGNYIARAEGPDLRSPIFDFVLQSLVNMPASKSPKKMEQDYKTRLPKNQYPVQMFKSKMKEGKVRDNQNRIKILKDYLPVFCSSEDQIDQLNQWRIGAYADLVPYPITQSQAWAVVKMVYVSSHFTSDQRTAIYDDQNKKTPGLAAELALNTVLALSAATRDSFDVIYQIFRETHESLTVKASYSEGWNNPVHFDWLQDPYKDEYFKDVVKLSKTLPAAHFQFFYTNLQPIDQDFELNISLFQQINLVGNANIGHMNNIKKIIEGLKLKDKLYIYNSLLKKQ